ncbi:hypothetical protein DL98DRAFT_647922 [Cadophora sp. DSE1049]|nr:hypothetical protein DL98DRAFT_647922 [Cadophora sp. DSE1049]
MATQTKAETYYTTSEYFNDPSPWSSYPLSKLISSILEPISPSEAIRESLHLSRLLLLSNHPSAANTLLTTIFTHGPSIIPPSRHEESTVHTSLSLEHFWLSHKDTHSRPSAIPALTLRNETLDEKLKREQWGKFRECTLTGWMKEHCNLREPGDVHCWRESEDPKMLAMCCRLLAKTKTRGEYVSLARMREALDAARKLYALPEERRKLDGSREARYSRHSTLLYRRLPMELAIRLGDLDVARDILSQALCQDGFCNGGSLEEFLMVPGVWDVLPLLNAEGRTSNQYFILKEDADVLVKGVVGALELRAKEGRQWSLAPDKLGWKELLERLARGAWKANKREYKEMGVRSWKEILEQPASEEEIDQAERGFGELPADFKDMCRVANGFKGGYHFLAGGIFGIDSMFLDDGETELEHYDGDFYPHEIDVYKETPHQMLQLSCYEDSDGYRHYIIPHKMWKDIVKDKEVQEGAYQYWHSTNWSATASPWNTVWDWVASLVEEVEGMVERNEKVEHYDFNGKLIEDEESDDEDSGKEKEENGTDEIAEESRGELNKKRKTGNESDDDWVKVDGSLE